MVEKEDGVIDSRQGFEVTISDASEEARVTRLLTSDLSHCKTYMYISPHTSLIKCSVITCYAYYTILYTYELMRGAVHGRQQAGCGVFCITDVYSRAVRGQADMRRHHVHASLHT